MQDLTGKMVSFSTVPASFHSTGTGSDRFACTTHVFSPSAGAPACADGINQKFRLVQILPLRFAKHTFWVEDIFAALNKCGFGFSDSDRLPLEYCVKYKHR